MAPRLVLAARACSLLTSCETLETSAAPCSQGDGEPVPWTMLQEPPANAVSYMQMAIADDTIGNRWSYWRSIWFAGPDGEIMLCRVGAGFVQARTWVFDSNGALTDDGIILLRGG